MPHQGERRDSHIFVDTSSAPLLDSHTGVDVRLSQGPGDPNALLLSLPDFAGKAQSYDVYDYQQATRPAPSQEYGAFVAHPSCAPAYVATEAQVPSGLPQGADDYAQITQSAAHHQQYATHDAAAAYYAHVDAVAGAAVYPAYLDAAAPAAPRPLPSVVSRSPEHGRAGSKVTLYFRSAFDLDRPVVKTVVMFGRTRCESVLHKTGIQGGTYHYALTADAPPPAAAITDPSSPQVPLQLVFDESPVLWEAPSVDFGFFTYLDSPPAYTLEASSPYLQHLHQQHASAKKRKLSPAASPRRSPSKKLPLQHLTPARNLTAVSSSAFGEPLHRSSGPEGHQSIHGSQQYYAPQIGQTTTSLQPGSNSPGWSYYPSLPSVTRSPSTAAVSAASRASQLLPSPVNAGNPALIRTTTLQQSPPTPSGGSDGGFNPYSVFPAKAQLKIEGDLDAMSKDWSDDEWSAGRRLVQFRRRQTGSVISATFEAVSLEARAPHSPCVSCIWWAEKRECYVTSVDTIALLEALVAERFTVEEKNRIRRNLEGYRPTTVTKARADCEEFFKLIMGFPNPKPRNIEKDVKVFPWRVLARALTKIIGKYSASYSSTAGALQPAGLERGSPPTTAHRHAPQHGYAQAMTANPYASTGLGIAGSSSSGPALSLSVPEGAAAHHQHRQQRQAMTAWPQMSSANYPADRGGPGSSAWEFSGASYTPLQDAHGFRYNARLAAPATTTVAAGETQLMFLHGHRGPSHPTSTS